MAFDNAGNLYGTTYFGGTTNNGTVFQLTPSGSGWTEKVIYNFQDGTDGRYPYSGLIFDGSGNLYGTTTDGGTGGGGTIFELSPSGGGWTYAVLYSLPGPAGDSCGPAWALTMDGPDILYDTTQCDGKNSLGNVFKLTNTNGVWTYTSLHDFAGGSNDGQYPASSVTVDSSGNLYGTAFSGGTGTACGGGCGVVWEIAVPSWQFVPWPPCRLVDTRNAPGEFGGPSLQAKSVRSFTIPDNKDCNIPASAAAYSLNVTVQPPQGGVLGYLTVWPTGEVQPYVSTMNSYDGRVKSGLMTVQLCPWSVVLKSTLAAK
jgi:uncharacterized repeat protein (TIGR03803 family)